MPLGRFPGTGPSRSAQPFLFAPPFMSSLPGGTSQFLAGQTGSLLAGVLNPERSAFDPSDVDLFFRAQTELAKLGLPTLTPVPTVPGVPTVIPSFPGSPAQFFSSPLNGQVPEVRSDSLGSLGANLASPSGDIPFAMTSPWRLTQPHHHHHDHHHHDGGY